jgi:replicative DNA helicase
MTQEKLPPHDIDAEEAVIGSLLVDGEAVHEIAPDLKPEDFYSEKNGWIYGACLGLFTRNEGINEVTVGQELARQDKLEKVGGSSYLAHLVAKVPDPFQIKFYGDIVSRLSLMRRLIEAGGKIARVGYRADPEVDAALAEAEDALFQVRKRSPTDFISLKDIIGEYFEHAGAARRQEEIAHITTGFRALDEFLGGLQRSDLIIVAARPTAGKTSLALSIARNAAANQQAHIAIFSLEMSRDAIGQRFLSSESGVDSKSLRLGQFSEIEEAQVVEASGALSELPIFIDDTPMLRVMEMRAKAKRLHYEQKVDLIIIDYLQLMQSDRGTESRVQEISEITRTLKAVAREINVPVIAVSQLSRAPESRMSHIPQLSDLRESGSIEQDADVVLFIYRPELYYKNPEEWAKFHDVDKEPYPRGIAEIHIAKHRNGPTGVLNLRFQGHTASFVNLPAEVGLQEV